MTFRALPAKEKVIEAYDVNYLARYFLKDYAHLNLFQETKKNIIRITDSVDPIIVTWENLG